MLNDVEQDQFIVQILSDLDIHCNEQQRRDILKRILVSFCPCCGCRIKTKEIGGASGALQLVCNHLGDELELTIESANGDSFRAEMPTNPCVIHDNHPEFIIETCDGDDEIYSGRRIRLIPA